MNKAILFGMLALALLGLTGSGVAAQATDITITLMEQNGSGQTGAAALGDSPTAGQVIVAIAISPSDVPQPAHIHKGTCANLDPKPAYPLTNVVNGESVTTVNTTMAELLSSPYAINVHKSGPEASIYVSCGDIVANVVGMPRSGSNQTVFLAALGLLAVSVTLIGMRLAQRKA